MQIRVRRLRILQHQLIVFGRRQLLFAQVPIQPGLFRLLLRRLLRVLRILGQHRAWEQRDP